MPKKPKEKIRVLRIINRFNIGGPTFNATFLTRFISDDYETMLVGGLPEPDESDSLHIPELSDCLEEGKGVKGQIYCMTLSRNFTVSPDFRQ